MTVPVILGALAGCSSGSADGERTTTTLVIDRDARSAACSQLLDRLPRSVLSLTRNSDSTAAGMASWGDPAVMLACGAPPTGPTTDECIEINDVAWVFTETPDYYRFLTYGRTPAVQVQVPTSVERTEATSALVDLNDAVAPLKKTQRKCYDVTDTVPTATAG